MSKIDQYRELSKQTARAAQGASDFVFSSWFGKSKVVDESGEPLMVYHGTNVHFTEFSRKHLGSNTGWDNTKLGFFFIADRSLAENFARETSGGSVIMSVYLSIQKPLYLITVGVFNNEEQAPTIYEIISGQRLSPADALEALNEDIGLSEWSDLLAEMSHDSARAIIERDGYDGVISSFGDGNLEYIAFHPEQIRSVPEGGQSVTDEGKQGVVPDTHLEHDAREEIEQKIRSTTPRM